MKMPMAHVQNTVVLL